MTRPNTPGPLDLETLALDHDRARQRAEALRRQALDDFWRGTDQVLSTAATRTLRAARRWSARLARHRGGVAVTSPGATRGLHGEPAQST